MLHSLIIMTGAGLTIFEKTWIDKFDDKVKNSITLYQTISFKTLSFLRFRLKVEQGKSLYGSLITGMQEFSRQSTGLIVSYIEFGNGIVLENHLFLILVQLRFQQKLIHEQNLFVHYFMTLKTYLFRIIFAYVFFND